MASAVSTKRDIGLPTRTDLSTTAHEPGTDVVASAPTQLFIGGSWRPASDGAAFDVHDPTTGAPLSAVASARAADGAARWTREQWAGTSPRVRADLFRSAFDRLVERAEDFAVLVTWRWASRWPSPETKCVAPAIGLEHPWRPTSSENFRA